jgi:hypothetical protein
MFLLGSSREKRIKIATVDVSDKHGMKMDNRSMPIHAALRRVYISQIQIQFHNDERQNSVLKMRN